MPASQHGTKSRAPAGTLVGAPWFDLHHYRGVPTWTRAEWFRAISCRHALKTFPSHGLPHHWEAIAKDCIRASGLLARVRDPLDGVRKWNEIGGAVATVELEDEEEDADLLQRLREGLSLDDLRVAAIDVARPDMEIKRDFSRWLKSQRKRRGIVREPVTTDDMKAWSNARVLPYIDIMQFAAATGKSFAPAEIQRALFLDREGIAVKGRTPKDIFWQSTRRHAKKLLSDGLFAAIAAEFKYVAPE